MNGPRASGPARKQQADATSSWRPSFGYLALAVGIVGGGLAYGWFAASAPPRDVDPKMTSVASAAPPDVRPVPESPSATVAASASEGDARAAIAPAVPASAAPAPPRIQRIREPGADQSPDLADYVNAGETPSMAEVIDRLHQAGVHSGLGAFSPPGTRPPRIGLAVPEDFPLPEGYVRHHQATDDGQRIEPVLMFAPDARLFDAAGRPIALPADGIVPPELAPPGLPMRRITVPAPRDAQGRGR